MNYLLMHKRVAVAEITIDEDTGNILKTGAVLAPEHLPVGVSLRRGSIDRTSLNVWWTDRSIPSARTGIYDALDSLCIDNPAALLSRCYGLSLSDQYWICPNGASFTWDDVNFFEHPFSEDIGNVLFGEMNGNEVTDFSSPDNTSDGNLKKRWRIINGKRCLFKGGSNPFRQQPFCEVIATAVARRLGIPCVEYTVQWHKGAPYSVCENLVTADTELIPAWRILQTQKKPNDRSVYNHFVECAKTLGIPEVTQFLDGMIVTDYLIANEDRHFNNFGAVRNADTLEWLGMAPLYDNGSSFGYDKAAVVIRAEGGIICKPFKRRHEEQLGLVRDPGFFDPGALSDLGDMIRDVMSEEKAKEYIGEDRIDAIAETAMRRVKRLREMASGNGWSVSDRTEDDAIGNIRASYD